MSVDDAIRYTFVWHSYIDARSCDTCRRLSEKTWTDQDLFQSRLWDPWWGDVFDLDRGVPLTHPNCRCQLECRVDFDWAKVQELDELANILHDYGLPRPESSVIEEAFQDMSEAREAVSGLRSEIRAALPEARELNQALTMYLALSRRLGLPGPILELMAKAQQGRIAVDTLTRSIQLFYATSGPIGWAILAGGLLLGGLMLVDMMEIRRPQY